MIRLSYWIESNGISRSTAYELLKLLNIQPLPRRVFGYRKPISHLTADQIGELAPLVLKLKGGSSFSQLRAEVLACDSYLYETDRSVRMLLETLRWIACADATESEQRTAARAALKQWGEA